MSDPHYGSGPVPPGAYAPRPSRPAPPRPEDLASWASRAVATLVDGLIVGAVTALVLVAAGAGLVGDGESVGVGDVLLLALLLVLVFTALAFLYAPLLMARTNGQTLGKKVAGIRVVRADGRRVDFWWAALREVAVKGLLVGVLGAITGGIAYLVDVLWPLADRQNRAVHDILVDSRVVRR